MSDTFPPAGSTFVPPAAEQLPGGSAFAKPEQAGPPIVTPPQGQHIAQAPQLPDPEQPSRLSLRDRILSVDDLRSDTVYVEEWNETVLVRGITVGERNNAISAARDPETGVMNLAVMYALMVISCALDPQTRQNIFTTGDQQGILAKSPGAIDKVALKAMALSGMTPPDSVPAGTSTEDVSIDAAGKGSSSTPGGASFSI